VNGKLWAGRREERGRRSTGKRMKEDVKNTPEIRTQIPAFFGGKGPRTEKGSVCQHEVPKGRVMG